MEIHFRIFYIFINHLCINSWQSLWKYFSIFVVCVYSQLEFDDNPVWSQYNSQAKKSLNQQKSLYIYYILLYLLHIILQDRIKQFSTQYNSVILEPWEGLL